MSADDARAAALRNRLAALTPLQRAKLERALGSAPAPNATNPSVAVREEDGQAFPLTDIQQAYWAGRGGDFDFGAVATHAYTEIDAVDLDLERLAASWNSLIERHEMLRAVIQADGMQRILAKTPPYEIALDDLRGLSAPAAGARLAAARARMSHQVLPADRWPIFEIRASRLDERRTRLHLSFDAIITDLTSRLILMREWHALYDGEANLPPITGGFRSFVLKEQAEQGGSRYGDASGYWQARIAALPPPPELPLCDPSTGRSPSIFTRRSRRFDAGRRDALDGLARRMGVTLNTLLLNAYADTLRLWSVGQAFTLNLTLFNRPATDAAMERVVGDFTTLTMTQIDAPGDDDLATRAARLQAQLWRDLDHRQFGGVRVLRETARRRAGAGPVLMPVVFTSALRGGDNDAATAWLGEEVYSVSQTPQVWIDLMIVGEGEGFAVHWNAVDALFPPGLMQDMFAAFTGLLDSLASGAIDGSSDWRAIAAALMPPAAHDAQKAANATDGPDPDRLLHQLWQDHVQASPDRLAVITPERTVSYGELAGVVAGLCHRLRAAGACPNTLVAVVMPKGWRQIAGVLAVLESGAAYLPIDPETPPARLHQLLADGEVRIAVTPASLAGSPIWPEGMTLLHVDEQDLSRSHAPLKPVQRMSDLAYVIYTSGSAGAPKGVAIDHRGAVNTILDINSRFSVGAEDRVLALSALTFDLSVYDIFGLLAAGGAIVMPDESGVRDPAHWAGLIADHKVSLWNSAPAFMDLLVDYARTRPDLSLPHLRLALLSGDRVPVSLPGAVKQLAPAARVVSLGGATEASIWSIFHEVDDLAPIAASVPYGKPLRNQTFRVLGPDGAGKPTWAVGELHIGGLGLAKGYWRDPGKTAAAFVSDAIRGERLYRTGDYGRYLPDGSIEFLGRKDNQVKVRGFRVELGEIETVLTRHPGIRDAAVVVAGKPGAGGPLAAFVVRSPEGALLSTGEIAAYLGERLPDYMLPSAITLLADLPLTANGKVDRTALALEAATRSPAARPAALDEDRPDQIAALVRRVCRVEVPLIDSSFLDLGLTSIDIIRMVNAIDAELGFRPNVEALYRTPTIRWLSAAYAAWLATSSAREPRSPGPVPLDPARREAFKKEGPARRSLPDSATSPLPTGAMSPELHALLKARRSVRRFSLRQVLAARLGQLLEGLRQDPDSGRFSYGSASGLYPVQAYLYVRPRRVEGLAAGAYYYDPKDHALRSLPAAAPLSRLAFSHHQNAPIFDEAAFVVFLVAELRAIEPIYGDLGLALASLEAGLMTQVLDLAASTCGLGLCQVGQVDDGAVRRLLHLTDSHRVLHAVFGGPPEATPVVGDELDAGTEEARMRRLIQRVQALDPAQVRTLLDADGGQ